MARSGDEAREALLDAAEHVFAIQGIETASLRDIAVEAGQRNNYAVQYHFGDRAGLVAAVFTRRMDAINEQRLQMIAEIDTTGSQDIQDLAAALMVPLINFVTSTKSWYGRFLLRTEFDHFAVTVKNALPVSLPVIELSRRIQISLDFLPRHVRRHRIEQMMTHYISAVADWEWSRDRRTVRLTVDELKEEVLATSCAILMAPASIAHSAIKGK
jgi:AcrR family transcriptional regulator